MTDKNTIPEKTDTSLTPAYAAVQGSFWMTFCIAVSFAAVYLQGLSYTNTALGMVMAAGSLVGAVLGPFLSSFVDRYETATPAKLVPPLLVLQAMMLFLLLLHPVKDALNAILFAFFMAFTISVNSMNLKLYVDVSRAGARIDYGFARGTGSLMYVFVSVILGIAVEKTSVRLIIIAGLLLTALQFLTHFTFLKQAGHFAGSEKDTGKGGVSIPAFLAGNRTFSVLLLGTALLFFEHNLVNNFLINIAKNAGGDTGTMGYLNGFMAAMEIPMMMLFTRLFGKRDISAIIRVAFVVFSVKALAIALATSVPALFLSLILQAPSFALYTAAIVPYTEKCIAYKDSAKAQSLAYAMTTVGGVLANIIGGRLFDVMSVTNTLLIGCAVSLAGTVVALLGTRTPR